ncbi:large-conductance mechanosensitive channel protein MscL [bacterium]|nr:large-conductance mechanosensitive channel protein MscL [bacterium]
MGFAQEFKEFAMKGNVVDLAVGVIIGGAFGKIVSAMVDKVLMPLIGVLMGGVDFTNLRAVIVEAGADGKGEVAIGYGFFIQTVVDFLIVAFCLFTVIKMMNKMKKAPAPAAAAPAEPSEDILLLRQIRDSLKK